MVAALALPPLLTPVPAAAVAYALSASPQSLTFVVGTTSPQDLTVTNTGSQPEVFRTSVAVYPFHLNPGTCPVPVPGEIGGRIDPGASCTMQVGFGPPTYGRFQGTVHISYGPVGSEYALDVPLTGYNYPYYGLYTLDAFGGVHPNASKPLAGAPSWPGWRIARALALLPSPNVSGGYVLDGYGGVHPIGSAPAVNDWPHFGWDIARDLKLLPNVNGLTGGYVLDGWGGIHPVGGAPGVSGGPYWPRFDIAKKLAILPDGSGGYVLDGWGGLHGFAIGSNPLPPEMPSAYWPGKNLARDIEFDYALPALGGVTLDAWGGIHPFGAEPAINQAGPFWPYQDVARAIRIDDSRAQPPQGWILDALGGLHSFGRDGGVAPPPYPYWSTPVAVDLAEY